MVYTMVKLTEEMVIARTRNSDLSSIKKLNCWGSDLSDVSLLRRMNNVEVLSLSVNQISTLADFQCCTKLQELYIRKNNIKNIREICYLKDLPHLKNLWIADNPCAEVDGYRLTVLRNLPQLQKLDDIPVQPEEIKEALRLGRELVLPSPEEIEEDDEFQAQPPPEPVSRKNSEVNKPNIDPPSRKNSETGKTAFEAPSRKSSETGIKPVAEPTSRKSSEAGQQQQQPLNTTYEIPNQMPTSDSLETFEDVQSRPQVQESPRRRSSTITLNSPVQESKPVESAPSSRRPSAAAFNPPNDLPVNNWVSNTQPASPVQSVESPQQMQQRCPVHNNQGYSTAPPTSSHDSTPSPAEFSGYNPHNQAPVPLNIPQPDPYPAAAVPDQRYSYHEQRSYRPLSEPNLLRGYPAFQPPVSYANHHQQQPQQPHHYQQPQGPNHYPLPGAERFSPTRPVGRARNRASNLLMAALCLVHELDYASLEVLAMAVRNRLDELDD